MINTIIFEQHWDNKVTAVSRSWSSKEALGGDDIDVRMSNAAKRKARRALPQHEHVDAYSGQFVVKAIPIYLVIVDARLGRFERSAKL